MSWLEHYAALIQLMSAVNFAYIVTHFPSKVFAMIFDVKKLLNNRLFSYIIQVSADIESLKVMQPIITNDGRSNEYRILELREDYNEHYVKWKQKKKEIKAQINMAKAVKGSKCIFLNVSLFCLLTLFNIATYILFENDFMMVFILLLNRFILFYSIYLSYIMWKHKWDQLSDVDCYRRTGLSFLLIVIVALVISGINSLALAQTGGTPIPDWLGNSVLSLCIILPFYPCLISILFVFFHEKDIVRYIKIETAPLRIEQAQLHERKQNLDMIDDLFTQPDFTLS